MSNVSTNSTKIKCLVFDIGRVLIHLHPERSFKTYQEMGLEQDFLDGLFKQEDFLYFERGLISEEEFYQFVLSYSKKDFSITDFYKVWNSFLGLEIAGLQALLLTLREKFKLCTLSNTNIIHWNAIKNYPIFAPFHLHFLSFQVGLRKPSPELYQEMLRKLSVRPDEILYFDDLIENVREARNQGIVSEMVCENISQIKYALQKHRLHP